MQTINTFLVSALLTFVSVPVVQADSHPITTEGSYGVHNLIVAENCRSNPLDPRPCRGK